MKTVSSALLFIVSLFLFSCSSTTKTKQLKSKTKAEKVVSNEILVAEVEGMVCKMGCGGSIRKELIQTNAVSKVDIEYEDGAKKQTIKVHYDNKLITQSEIVRKLEKINKGQFKVFPIGTSEIQTSTSGSSYPSGINMAEKTFELPNLLGILSSFITE
jgi:copper chaperone CopZ